MDTGSPDAVVALRRVGFRVTSSRLAALPALVASAPHPTAAAAGRAVCSRCGAGFTQTVCNVPRTLTDVGPASRLDPAGGPGPCARRVNKSLPHTARRRSHAFASDGGAAGDTPRRTAVSEVGFIGLESQAIDGADARVRRGGRLIQ